MSRDASAPRGSRREFLAIAFGAASAGACRSGSTRRAASAGAAGPEIVVRHAPIPLRSLGRTGRELPCLGLGCYPLGQHGSSDDAEALVAHAYDTGARYFDTAPSYARSEERLGRALAGKPREGLWIATKTLERDGDAALAELERSLERLRTEYVDSVQVHEVHDDVDAIFAKGGVVAALEAARARKQLRWVGITGHRDPRWLLDAIERHEFATVLCPVNPLDVQQRSFTRTLAPRAREKGVAVIAMKVYAGGHLVQGDPPPCRAGELVQFALAQPGVCVAVPGADSIAHWDEARAACGDPLPDEAAQRALIERVSPHRGKKSEWYKDT